MTQIPEEVINIGALTHANSLLRLWHKEPQEPLTMEQAELMPDWESYREYLKDALTAVYPAIEAQLTGERRKAKGTPTRKAYLALADSVADVRVLMAEIERLRARLDAVKEIGSEHWNAQIKRESKFGRTGSSCVCEVCNIMRALKEGEQG